MTRFRPTWGTSVIAAIRPHVGDLGHRRDFAPTWGTSVIAAIDAIRPHVGNLVIAAIRPHVGDLGHRRDRRDSPPRGGPRSSTRSARFAPTWGTSVIDAISPPRGGPRSSTRPARFPPVIAAIGAIRPHVGDLGHRRDFAPTWGTSVMTRFAPTWGTSVIAAIRPHVGDLGHRRDRRDSPRSSPRSARFAPTWGTSVIDAISPPRGGPRS